MSSLKFGFFKQKAVTPATLTDDTVTDSNNTARKNDVKPNIIRGSPYNDDEQPQPECDATNPSNNASLCQEKKRDPSNPVPSHQLDSEVKLGPVRDNITPTSHS